jgi:hypothetical protein
MTEKILCVNAECNGSIYCVRLEDWKEALIPEIDSIMTNSEPSEEIILTLTEMDEEEFNNLPEFDGW